MNAHTLTLLGGPHGELRLPASLLHEAVGALLDGARLATRFAVEGQSVRNGPRPKWLDAACAVDVTGLTPGSAVIAMEAPTLVEVDPVKIGSGGQRSLFEDDGENLGEQTAVDLFGQILASLVERSADEIVADRALLDGCARFAKVSGEGFDGVQLDGLRGRAEPLVIAAHHVREIELLRDETPPSQAVRVSGTLDTISASNANVALKLKDGATVPARMDNHDPAELRTLFGKPVVVSGVAHYRPSGRLLMVNVESIGKADAGDVLFETAPLSRERLPVAAPVAQDESSGVSAFFGTWPGDESDEELLEALAAIE